MNDKRHNMREAAEELGVARQTLYYWSKKGWVEPKRDYRNLPVFTEDNLKKIDEWKDRLKLGGKNAKGNPEII